MTEDNLPLAEQIDRDLWQAMRDRDDVTKNTLRSVKTAMTEASKSGEQHEQSEDEILAVIQKQAKQRRSATPYGFLRTARARVVQTGQPHHPRDYVHV